MKKLILIFGIFAVIFVVISGFAQMYRADTQVTQSATENQSEVQDEAYTVKSENGRIVVYQGDTLIQRTATHVSTLPKKDQKALLYGIKAEDMEQVDALLMDYCS